jgi:nucleotide-binding universal stress UspA family protein
VSPILIGVDDSTRSEDAVAFGRRLAGATDSDVIVACAFPYNDMPSRSASQAYREALKDDATATARKMSRLLDLPDERVEIAVIADPSAARALHELAEQRRADLVIVGHTHSGRAGRLVPGATAERLVHGAPCPVAVVPEGFRDRPLTAPRRIGAAYTNTPESVAALAAAASAARALGTRLDVIGVVPQALYETSPMRGEPNASEMRADAARYVHRRLEKIVNGLGDEVWAEAVKLEGHPAERLAEHSAGLDVLVMGSRGYGPLHAVLAGGVSGQVIREARCPVIVVPRGVDAPLGALFGKAAATSA